MTSLEMMQSVPRELGLAVALPFLLDRNYLLSGTSLFFTSQLPLVEGLKVRFEDL